jgi:iron(III) transport system ATP-binding protein
MTALATPLLQVKQLCCHHGQTAIVTALDFHVNHGDMCSLLGPSGCGKTTVLRAIAGFHPLSSGEIILGDQVLSSSRKHIPPESRQIGMVFQDYALFPHLTVSENIRFGLSKLERKIQNQRIEKMLGLVELQNMAKRYPHELSGGQQQRVALARALAPQPKLLLLDEPFSNLDVELRRNLNLEVRQILKETGTSAILVTHDQEEAFAFADQIGLINAGKLQQWDTPFNLYHEPLNCFVANFIGQGSMLSGVAITPESVSTELGTLCGNRAYPWKADTPVKILIRPDDILTDPDSDLEALILKKVFSGSSTLYTLALASGEKVKSMLPSHLDYQVGDKIKIRAEVEHLIAFDKTC